MVRHVALFRWKDGTTAADVSRVEEGLRPLPSQIPCIRAYRFGRDLGIQEGNADFAVAAAFGDYLSRRAGRWFVPNRTDLLLQTAYYVLPNAAIEEWFFRGFLQGTLVRWWHAPWLGLAAATLVFGAYHVLGRWGWRPVLGATVAGAALGTIYLWQPQPPSLLLPVIVHACITAGFLSVGPYVLFAWRRARGRIRPQVELPGAVS